MTSILTTLTLEDGLLMGRGVGLSTATATTWLTDDRIAFMASQIWNLLFPTAWANTVDILEQHERCPCGDFRSILSDSAGRRRVSVQNRRM